MWHIEEELALYSCLFEEVAPNEIFQALTCLCMKETYFQSSTLSKVLSFILVCLYSVLRLGCGIDLAEQ